ncbi:MAG: divalent-cation tolerance protein CutA [bacterium]|nr:divalent-cation tolerance protein CutA [bacterium]
MNVILIYSTFPSRKQALKTGEGLVKNKLAGCVNVFPVASVYAWQGKIIKDKEWVMIAKTKKSNYQKAEKYIVARHPYKTPCVLEIPVRRVAKKYNSWLEQY